MNKITIVGLGWLGLPLAKYLAQKGLEVTGTVRSSQKSAELSTGRFEVIPYQLGDNVDKEILKSDVIIYTIPASVKDYVPRTVDFAHALSPSTRFIFISSTSVYPDSNDWVTESEAEIIKSTHSGVSLYALEKQLQNHLNQMIALRMAGLFGPGRHPGRFLAGRTQVAGGQSHVNLVHQEDCIGIIEKLLKVQEWPKAMNICCDEHPTRAQFYAEAAKHLSLTPPTFSEEKKEYKIVSNALSKEWLNYEYQFPDPIAALKSI